MPHSVPTTRRETHEAGREPIRRERQRPSSSATCDWRYINRSGKGTAGCKKTPAEGKCAAGELLELSLQRVHAVGNLNNGFHRDSFTILRAGAKMPVRERADRVLVKSLVETV